MDMKQKIEELVEKVKSDKELQEGFLKEPIPTLEKLLGVDLPEEQLKQKVAELGAQITADYQGKNPLIVSVLKGSYVFMADLTRRIDVPCQVDFMVVSSYGAGTKTSGEVQIIKDLENSIDGRDLIIVEDILDSGVTLSYLMKVLTARGANSIRLCTLLSKPERRKVDVPVDYLGFEIPDEFVVGYGLDFAEKYRNLPYIGILKPSVYSEA